MFFVNEYYDDNLLFTLCSLLLPWVCYVVVDYDEYLHGHHW